jgi:2-amino-4-hydroxy-6-hydroxymethyldihydropteridine diphosphokinase
VYVGIGSNVERDRSVRAGLRALRERFGELCLSRVYETTAVGFAGEPFYNLVAGFDTDLAPAELAATLRDIETRCGRRRGDARFASRTLDVDLLLYGELATHGAGPRVPRPEILEYGFVLGPLAEIAPDLRHPVLGERIEDLWARFEGSGRDLVPKELDLES